MNETTVTVEEARPATAFPVANEFGVFQDDDCETIFAPVLNGVDAAIRVVQQADGWRYGWSAELPEAALGVSALVAQMPLPSREEAIIAAAEELIGWLSGEKDKGSKRHQKLAAKMQDWALDLEKKTAAAPAEDRRGGEPTTAPESAGEADTWVPTARVEMAGETRMIPLSELYESPMNPRQYYPEAKMQELVASMRQSGFRPWLPLLVRPIGAESEIWRPVGAARGFEIGAGHRRFRAAKEAGLTEVPCVVREMGEEEFLEVLNCDNSGRQDVHPLDEAAGWREWMKRTGITVQQIADRIGQSKEYVYQRLKYQDLIPGAHQAFLEDEFSAAHAIVIARRPADVQAKSLEYYRQYRPGYRELEQWILQKLSVELASAPFDLVDAELVSQAGACATCPKMGANIPGFTSESGDLAICIDVRCFGIKKKAYIERAWSTLRLKSDCTAVRISAGSQDVGKGVYTAAQYEEVPAEHAGRIDVRPALFVDGPRAGATTYVRLKTAAAKASPAASCASAAAREERAAGPSPRQVQEAEELRQKAVERELTIRRAILAEVTKRIGGLCRGDIEALLIKHFGGFDVEGETICELHGIAVDGAGAGEALKAALPKMREDELYAVVVESAVIEELQDWRAEQEPAGLLALAKRYKVDASKIRRAMEDRAKEAEGGTRREVVRKPKKTAKPLSKPAAKKAAVKKPGASKAAAGIAHRLHSGAGKKKIAKKGGKK